MIVINSICKIYFHRENEHSILNASPKIWTPREVFLMLQFESEPPGGFVEKHITGHAFRVWFTRAWAGQKICISNKFTRPYLEDHCLRGPLFIDLESVQSKINLKTSFLTWGLFSASQLGMKLFFWINITQCLDEVFQLLTGLP